MTILRPSLWRAPGDPLREMLHGVDRLAVAADEQARGRRPWTVPVTISPSSSPRSSRRGQALARPPRAAPRRPRRVVSRRRPSASPPGALLLLAWRGRRRPVRARLRRPARRTLADDFARRRAGCRRPTSRRRRTSRAPAACGACALARLRATGGGGLRSTCVERGLRRGAVGRSLASARASALLVRARGGREPRHEPAAAPVRGGPGYPRERGFRRPSAG